MQQQSDQYDFGARQACASHVDTLGERHDEQPNTAARPFHLLFFALVALAATIWLSICAIEIESAYLANYGFYFDPAAYYLRDIEVFRLCKEHGPWPVFLNQLQTNVRDPGRVLPYLLVAPGSLATLWSHMWTEMPFVWSFLTLLSSAVYERTRSALMSLGAISLFLALPMVLDPVLGVASYWLDFTSACALATGLLCVLRSNQTGCWRWAAAAGLFISAAVFCRWTSFPNAFLALTLTTLPMLFSLAPKDRRSVLIRAVWIGIGALPGLVLVTYGWSANLDYYRHFGYAMGQPISASISFVTAAICRLAGWPVLAVAVCLMLFNLLSLRKDRSNISFTLSCFGFPVSVLIFLCCIARVVEAVHPVTFFIPGLMIAALLPLRAQGTSSLKLRVLGGLLLLLSLPLVLASQKGAYAIAASPPDSVRASRETCAELAKLIISKKAPSFAEFDSETCMPHMEAFFFGGVYCTSVTIISEHEAYLRNLYKGLAPDEMAQQAFDRVKKELALVAVFANPEDAQKPGAFDNRFSSTIAQIVSQKVSQDQAFAFVKTVRSPRGGLAVYRNTQFAMPPVAGTRE